MPKQHHCEKCGAAWVGPSCRPCFVCSHPYVTWTNAAEWLDEARARRYLERTGHTLAPRE